MVRIGIKETIAPRTVQTLRLLDLTDDDGNPTPTLESLRRAPEHEFRTRLAEVVASAYADVLRYIDLNEADPIKIRDAFRTYKPYAMHDRMARLFVGLLAHSGLIPEAPAIPKLSSGGASKRPRAGRTTSKAGKTGALPSPSVGAKEEDPTPAREFRPSPPPATGLHPFIRGLIETLPVVGAPWPDEKRQEWVTAALGVFNLIYERPNGLADAPDPNRGAH
jgi:hypothetical protein